MAVYRTCDGIRRRDFFKVGAIGSTLLAWDGYLRLSHAGHLNPHARAKSAIFIDLRGGQSHYDTFDLKPEAPQEYRGFFQPIQTRIPGITVGEHLPKLAGVMDRFTILRGVSHNIGDHNLGARYVNTGNRPSSVGYPCYGAVATKELGHPADLPGFVAIPGSDDVHPGYLGVQYAPLATNSTPMPGKPYSVPGISLADGLTLVDVEKRQDLLRRLDGTFAGLEKHSQLVAGLDRFSQQVYSILVSARSREAFDVSRERASFAAKFGESPFGQSCLLATRLVEHGVPFVSIATGGWDTHKEHEKTMKELLPPFDEGLAALLVGLEEKGLLDSTIVFATGEFGRTPKVNSNLGTDHFPRCMCMLLAGGGVSGGRAIGQSNETATEPFHKGFSPEDVAASFYHALGIDHQKEYHTSTGRPIMIVRDGRVIEGLFV